MSQNDISRYPVPDVNSLPEDIRDRILAVQDKAGFVPNVFLTLAHRPAEFRAFFEYHDAIMEREGSTLTAAEKEMIIVATSAANGCQYCVVAHGALLRIFAKDTQLADQIAINYLHAPITDKQKAMLDFAMTLSRNPELVSDADYADLKEHGFDDEDILDIAGVTAFFGLSNRMAIVTAMQPNPEFYVMARTPKA
ncbi:peroxidase-related enzyme [Amphritea balenae]|uniref:Alkylhydroperoxidase n=1 Tax=Amphritea balenae TaxID=452629 RepID=A0A3P1SQ47_9GAMM|nr:peroxidase-related enzyme [Amphritea balenae]RRC99286.1 alkylhydroperoxidase [Amphritea balenae]GGK72366.1 alkyl hydroperoxide reductase AhpD [Amphritea balenae]